ncbi:MAG: serine/threonine protein phosphatase [Candidatus Competibacteraceae bacterium]|nr:serine/threonine protein phosphatase [Candidatus Competibacteraceae bacterium]
MKSWVIGDIHGCARTLQALVENHIIPSSNDHIYFIGDYIDRGPSSRQTIDYIWQLASNGIQIHALQGNHEEMLVNAYDSAYREKKKWFTRKNSHLDSWLMVGGKDTLNSFNTNQVSQIPDSYISWMRNLSLYAETTNFLIVHAGFNFKESFIFEDKKSMKWIRNFEVDMKKTHGKRVIHGHVPVPAEVIINCVNSDQYPFIAIDNGCVYKGRNGMGALAAVEINSMQLCFQPNVD